MNRRTGARLICMLKGEWTEGGRGCGLPCCLSGLFLFTPCANRRTVRLLSAPEDGGSGWVPGDDAAGGKRVWYRPVCLPLSLYLLEGRRVEWQEGLDEVMRCPLPFSLVFGRVAQDGGLLLGRKENDRCGGAESIGLPVFRISECSSV